VAAEIDADANSEDLDSNNGKVSSNSKNNNCMDTKILKSPDKNENKKMRNNVGLNGDNSSETRELQQ